MIYIYIGLVGALGAMLRYSIGILIMTEHVFPYATLLVNLIGSFLLAWLTYGLFKRIHLDEKLKTAITTGFVGSFTTFSAVSVETVELFQNQSMLLGCVYVFVSLVGGLGMCEVGFRVSRGVGEK
ncbi:MULTISPECIES: fluoride efflux transporter CrcB [Oceanobacillus]|uniref:Fluoride-specific ion channel FluC n=1 Tax=Oceanobacillus indicireducens TaxID=1004261 RepID=A0A917Y4L6_9BACI|nr:fluoride efflux transporter CrcB [Oceanobacillus indicireducens]GGN66079.1 chromosome condensation protein CcrB [Oceanobacillus indicireducens]